MEVWIGLGGNLGDVPRALRSARRALEALARGPLRLSPIYETEPWGSGAPPGQRFLNQVAGLSTDLAPLPLLGRLQEIERSHGRVRGGPRGGPRSLDLDLLCWEGGVFKHPALVLPHPRLALRRFVLVPWAVVAPELKVPGLDRRVDALLADCLDRCSVRRWSPPA